jgi:hypothetical protein
LIYRAGDENLRRFIQIGEYNYFKGLYNFKNVYGIMLCFENWRVIITKYFNEQEEGGVYKKRSYYFIGYRLPHDFDDLLLIKKALRHTL